MHKVVIIVAALLIAVSLTASPVRAQSFWDWILSFFFPSASPAGEAYKIVVPLLACSDNDFGLNYKQKGQTELLEEAEIITNTDSCSGDVLTEYYCDVLYTSVLSTTVNCKTQFGNNYFCYDGSCKEGTQICSGSTCLTAFTDGEYACSDSQSCQFSLKGAATASGFICADVNGDTLIDLADIVYLVNYIFKGGAAPKVIESADVNSDGKVDLSDVIYLVNYMLKGGPAPVCKEPPFVDLSAKDIVFLPDSNATEGDTRTVQAVIGNTGNVGDSFKVDYTIKDPSGAVVKQIQVTGNIATGSETTVETDINLNTKGTWTATVSVAPVSYTDKNVNDNKRTKSIVVNPKTQPQNETFIDLSVKDIIFLPNENPAEGDNRTVKVVVGNSGNTADSYKVDYAIKDPKGVTKQIQLAGSVGAGGESAVQTDIALNSSGQWTFTATVSPVAYADKNTSNNARTEGISVAQKPKTDFVDLIVRDITFLPNANPTEGDNRNVQAGVGNIGDIGDSFRINYSFTDPHNAKYLKQLSGIIGAPAEITVETGMNFNASGTWTVKVSISTVSFSDANYTNNQMTKTISVANRTAANQTFADIEVADIVFEPDANPSLDETRNVKAVVKNLGTEGSNYSYTYILSKPSGVSYNTYSGFYIGPGETKEHNLGNVVFNPNGTFAFTVNASSLKPSDANPANNIRTESIVISQPAGTEDTTPPAVTLIYPPDNAYVTEGVIVFRYMPSDANLDACSFWAGSGSSWELLASDYNPESDVENNFTMLGYAGSDPWNVQCTDTYNNIGWNQKNFTINIRATPNNPPSKPALLTPVTGAYNLTNPIIPVICSGSSDPDNDSVFYTIQAFYDFSWKILESEGDGKYQWNISRISSQIGVDLRCQSTDLTDTSDYLNPEGTLVINTTADNQTKQSHFTCQDRQCIEAEGPGSDSCFTSADCEVPYCGDGECDSDENSDACPQDCKAGITPPGDVEGGLDISGDGTPPEIRLFQLSDAANGMRAMASATDTESGVKDMVFEVSKNGALQKRFSKPCNSDACTIIKDFDYGEGEYSVSLSVVNGASFASKESKTYEFKAGYCGDGFCKGNETNTTCTRDCEGRISVGVSEAKLISDIEGLKEKVTDEEQKNLISYTLLQVADRFDVIETREKEIASRGIIYGILKFFCMQAETELGDARFYLNMASEVENTRNVLSFLREQAESSEVRDEMLDRELDLFGKVEELKEKAALKQQGAGGICGARELM